MEEEDLDVFYELDAAILKRCSERLSEMLPKRLRFSEALVVKRNVNLPQKKNGTFRADQADLESKPLKVTFSDSALYLVSCSSILDIDVLCLGFCLGLCTTQACPG